MRAAASLLILVCLLVGRPSAAAEQTGPYTWIGVERLVVLGDVHGSFDKMASLLAGTGLVDGELHWAGGETHLLFLGDLTDRGPRERPVLDLARRLEAEAEAAGGRVHVLLGNHEVMNIIGDLRYVEGDGFSDFAGEETAADRDAALARFREINRGSGASGPQIRAAFDARYPPGFFGRLRAFSDVGDYGRWLLGKPAVVRVNGYLFLHGGLTERVAALGLEGINEGVVDSVQGFLDNRRLVVDGSDVATYEETWAAAEAIAGNRSVRRREPEKAAAADALLAHFDGLAFTPDGPLWYRGNSVETEQIERANLEPVLEHLEAWGVVVAHTPTGTGRVTSRFNGRIHRADVGMAYGRRPLCLVFEGAEIREFDPATRAYAAPLTEPPSGERFSAIDEQLPDKQLERFLQRSKVGDRLRIERKGRVGEVIALEHKGLELRGVFLQVDDPPGEGPGAPARRYVHEVAAYRLDRLLGLGLVPVTIVREIDGDRGSLQTWTQEVVDLAQLQEYGRLDLLDELEDEILRAKIFNALIAGRDRADFGKMLIPKERRVMLADNTLAFPSATDVDHLLPDDCRLDSDLALGLRNLDDQRIDAAVGDLLDAGQVAALLARRDAILASCGS